MAQHYCHGSQFCGWGKTVRDSPWSKSTVMGSHSCICCKSQGGLPCQRLQPLQKTLTPCPPKTSTTQVVDLPTWWKSL